MPIKLNTGLVGFITVFGAEVRKTPAVEDGFCI
jgi:hypothetical protein